MIKAKTKKNMFRILSTILGAVFALITGVTYCAKSLNLQYGLNPNSTSAYLGNQQYVVVNDTVQNPILFGEGSHNFEIALQYAFDYNFDVRLKYEMVWSQGVSVNGQNSRVATNVILHFADRNNIIYDEEYIFVANSVTAGNGKLTFITGVDFVDPTDSRYYGQTLQINIIDVKIYKQADSYDKSTHFLTTQDADNKTPDEDISTSVAAQAWINYKNRARLTNASVMMYNYRRNYETGVPYSGLNTAYRKTTNSSNSVTNAVWLGGNKAYAGTGMYIITGTTPIKFQVEVAGIWRDNSGNVTDKSMISENSIKYNYSEDFVHASWDNTRLWETRTFNYVVPANSAYYIDILDSVEITSADRIEDNLYDSYRLVTNSITINPGLTKVENETPVEKQVKFSYNESSADFIQIKDITTNENVTATTSYANKPNKDIKVVNSSKYLNGLYEARVGQSTQSQDFKTNISLINTTATTKTVTITYQLKYTISNGQTNLTNVVKENEVDTYTRAEEYITGDYTQLDAFKSNLYYSYSLESDELSTGLVDKVTIAPYSSVTLADSYTVNSGLQQDIIDIFDTAGAGGVQADGLTENYDVWTFLNVTPSVAATTETKANLVIEKSISENTVELSVKNNTKTTITGVTISAVEAVELSTATYSPEGGDTAPNDWNSSYWKYYKLSDDETTYIQLTTKETYVKDKYYSKSQTYKNLTVTAQNGFIKDENDTSLFTHTTKVLRPGEEVVFGVATTSATKQVYATASATSSSLTTENTAMLINAGNASYIVNNSSTTSYYVRFSGTYVGTDTTHIKQGGYTENQTTVTHNYYIGILRPGQIVAVPLSSVGTMGSADMVEATSNYYASTLTSKKWSSTIITDLTALFT